MESEQGYQSLSIVEVSKDSEPSNNLSIRMEDN